MTSDEKACLQALKETTGPVWINRVVAEGTDPIHGHQLYMPPTRARAACAALEARGLVASDGKEKFTMAVWITPKGRLH